jgi:hypothetical protein
MKYFNNTGGTGRSCDRTRNEADTGFDLVPRCRQSPWRQRAHAHDLHGQLTFEGAETMSFAN